MGEGRKDRMPMHANNPNRRHPGGAIKPGLIVGWMLLLIAVPMMAGVALAASDLSGDQWLQLDNGDVVVAVQPAQGASKGTVEATILIDAPAERIWQVMLDCHEIPTFVPGVTDCQVLESGENWEIIRHQVKWIWLFPELSYVFRAQYLPRRQIDFTRIAGDIRDMRGRWRLIPIRGGSQTLVRYRVYLDPGFLVPQWLVRHALKSDLPDVLTALRTRVLSDPTTYGH
jgi:ribosome-associated toxin RatA of RatAB toxin-antitoxin module